MKFSEKTLKRWEKYQKSKLNNEQKDNKSGKKSTQRDSRRA